MTNSPHLLDPANRSSSFAGPSHGIAAFIFVGMALVLGFTLTTGLVSRAHNGGQGGTVTAAVGQCLSRPDRQITVLPEALQRLGAFRKPAPPDEHTFDARGWRSSAYGVDTLYPFSLGKEEAPEGVCIVGGKVVGSQPKSLTWRRVKNDYDGDALRIEGRGTSVVNGFRASNVEDGISPHGDRSIVRISNAYLSYVRDDCIENDSMVGGTVTDSLFDGCFIGVSERSDDSVPQPRGETFTLNGVLLRLQPMPFDTDVGGSRGAEGSIVHGKAHGQLFKWSEHANRLVLRNSIFLVPRLSNNGARSMDFPPGTVAENVILIWLGPGDYPGDLPDTGVTVVEDESIWEAAKRRWLRRHGCTSIDNCDSSNLIAPRTDIRVKS